MPLTIEKSNKYPAGERFHVDATLQGVGTTATQFFVSHQSLGLNRSPDFVLATASGTNAYITPTIVASGIYLQSNTGSNLRVYALVGGA